MIKQFEELVSEKKIASWKCDGCGLMSQKDKDFLFIYGDIMIGQDGGLVGHNFDENLNLARVSIYCHECFRKIGEDEYGR